jgi:hypothetical protein
MVNPHSTQQSLAKDATEMITALTGGVMPKRESAHKVVNDTVTNNTVVNDPAPPLPQPQAKKHFQLIERTYKSNTESDYTEKIAELGHEFDYEANRHHYWGDPKLSTFYGTPFYAACSESQKLGLNHLYWIGQYHHTAGSEMNTMLFNQVTTGVFAHLSDYHTLCQELELETAQERFHINTFQKIGYKTKLALMGKEALVNPLYKKLHNTQQSGWQGRLAAWQQKLQTRPNQASLMDSSLRFLTRLFFAGQSSYYSEFLREKGEGAIPTTSGGLAGLVAPAAVFKFMTLNWGSSPFMAAQYYSARMIANMSLKAYEHSYFKHYKDLERSDEFIPAPTRVSYFHLLDESFHTTMSQTIAQEVYKDFPKPNAYEQTLANIIIWLTQRGALAGVSGVLPATFRDDQHFMPNYYRFLTSRLFGLNTTEALDWMEQCLCHEHDGFHQNLKHQQALVSEFQKFFGKLDYLWPVNREMRIMASGGSIEQAIQRNRIAFDAFRASVLD